MSFISSNLALLAQVVEKEVAAVAWYNTTWFMVLCILAVFLLPLALAQFLASSLRMREYTTKFYFILFAVTAGLFVVRDGKNIRLDIDLKGGTELIYELDQSKKIPGAQVDMDQMIAALRQRIDPAGVKQTRIRKYGAEQVEITIPEVDQNEVRQLKLMISSAGILEFRILADPSKNEGVAEQALKLPDYEVDVRAGTFDAENDNPYAESLIAQAKRLGPDQNRFRRDVDGAIAEWVTPTDDQRERMKTNKRLVTRKDGSEILVIKDRLLARWVKAGIDPTDPEKKKVRVQPSSGSVNRVRADGTLDFLVMIDPMNVQGVQSARAAPDDRSSGWLVTFKFEADRAERFGRLTAANQKDEETGQPRLLGIVLDDELLSAPALQAVISSEGQITGDFTKEDTQWLARVLNAGSLPAALSENPIREQGKSALLGKETIDKGKTAITISFFAVMIFMPLYYRFGGLVAAFALTLNLVLVLAIMILFKARFSLPGMAGLVLTVGMAVDANVLIFERIREELNRGAALRMAIRNGFDRATRTIVDANVTTLITGIVLYVIGSEQIKGFAVTLILGIAMSMFTAIFCSRVIFDVAEKRRWITTLGMARLFGETKFDFLSKRGIAAVCSIALISLGLFATFSRGTDMLAIDFTGGSKLLAVAVKEKDPEELTEMLLAVSPDYAESQRPKDVLIQNFGQQKDDGTGSLTTFDISSNSFPTSAKHIATLAYKKAKVSESQGTESYRVQIEGSIAEADVQAKITEATDAYVKSLELDPRDTTVTVTKESVGGTAANEDEEAVEMDESDEGKMILFAVETSQPDVDVVRATVALAFGDLLKSNHLTFDKAAFIKIDEAATEPVTSPAAGDAAAPGDDQTSLHLDSGQAPKSIAKLTYTPVLAQPAEEGAPAEGAPAEGAPAADPLAETDPPAAGDATDEGAIPADAVPADAAEPVETRRARFAGGTQASFTLDIALNQQTLHRYIQEVMSETDNRADFRVFNEDVAQDQTNRKTEWQLESTLNADQTDQLLTAVANKMSGQPVFPSANAMGSLVAGNQQGQALGALIASLVFIVGYIWIRFQRVIYGLAAVVALVHDVLVTLGMLALSGYIAQFVFFHDFLLIEHFKISLEILAAFLTIIGYSLNDTIVVFDRIREVRGKSPDLTAGMINKSINQTLSRTVLTSLTTLIVVAILYVMGGPGIHGFAYALVTGVMVGTYSSIFVASPVLLWLSRSGLNVPDEVVEGVPAGAATAG